MEAVIIPLVALYRLHRPATSLQVVPQVLAHVEISLRTLVLVLPIILAIVRLRVVILPVSPVVLRRVVPRELIVLPVLRHLVLVVLTVLRLRLMVLAQPLILCWVAMRLLEHFTHLACSRRILLSTACYGRLRIALQASPNRLLATLREASSPLQVVDTLVPDPLIPVRVAVSPALPLVSLISIPPHRLHRLPRHLRWVRVPVLVIQVLARRCRVLALFPTELALRLTLLVRSGISVDRWVRALRHLVPLVAPLPAVVLTVLSPSTHRLVMSVAVLTPDSAVLQPPLVLLTSLFTLCVVSANLPIDGMVLLDDAVSVAMRAIALVTVMDVSASGLVRLVSELANNAVVVRVSPTLVVIVASALIKLLSAIALVVTFPIMLGPLLIKFRT